MLQHWANWMVQAYRHEFDVCNADLGRLQLGDGTPSGPSKKAIRLYHEPKNLADRCGDRRSNRESS